MQPVIISAALVGFQPAKDMNPAPPHSPAAIADSPVDVYRAGAVIVHSHVRDPEGGASFSDLTLSTTVAERVRACCPVPINPTTRGFHLEGQVPEARLAPLFPKPDPCSLDADSVHFVACPFIDDLQWHDTAARCIQAQGAKPEMEAFGAGHIDKVTDPVNRGPAGCTTDQTDATDQAGGTQLHEFARISD